MNTLGGHTAGVRSLVISKEGQLFSGSADKTIKVWDIDSERFLKDLTRLSGAILSLEISKQDELLIGSAVGIRSLNINTGEILKTFPQQPASVNSIAIGKDGSLISGSAEGRVRVWDISNGVLLESLEPSHSSVVRSVISYKDYIISGSEDRKINI